MDIRRPLEAELLGILCEHKEFVKIVSLRPEDFIDPRNAVIFRALTSIKTDHSAYTVAQAVQALDGSFDLEYLEQVWMQATELPTVAVEDLQSRVVAIREEKLRLEAKNKLRTIVSALDDPRTDFQSALDQTNSLVMVASQGMLGQTKPTVPDVIDRAYAQKPGVKFPTGLTAIDQSLSSEGMRHGHVWLVTGGYKGFKTVTSLNIINNLLHQGRSVAYIGLEDSDVAFLETITAIDSGVPIPLIERYHADQEPIRRKDFADAVKESERWLRHDVGSRFRIYTADFGIHRWDRFPTLAAADCAIHSTDLIVVDNVQLWSEAREELEQIAKMLVTVANERKVCILALSQMSQENIRSGTHAALLSTKNSGSFGAACHVGIEIKTSPETSNLRLTAELLEKINKQGVQHFVGMDAGPPIQGSKKSTGPSELVEIGLWLKTVRRGRRARTMALLDPQSGKILLQYSDPIAMEPW